MPSMFDSHEEFNEWFSKDIESHAEKKSILDESGLAFVWSASVSLSANRRPAVSSSQDSEAIHVEESEEGCGA